MAAEPVIKMNHYTFFLLNNLNLLSEQEKIIAALRFQVYVVFYQ